ncbi:ABC transporter substrate-binding protein [Burkholderia stagnalis]
MHVCVALLLSSCLLSAHAQQDPRLKQAQASGKVSWYAAIFPDELRRALIAAFRKQTGIDVTTYVGGTGQVFSRLTTEQKTGAYGVDVVTIADTDLIASLIKAGAIDPYHSAAAAAIPANLKDEAGYWYGYAYWALALEYNTRLLKAADAPKQWADLADPKWRGKLAMTDPSSSAAGLLFLKAMVAEQGWPWIDKLLANQPLISAVGPGVDQAVVKGERVVGTTVSAYASQTMHQGGPVGISGDQVLFISPMTVSIAHKAPNRAGAELFVDFLLSKEAAPLYAQYGWFAARAGGGAPYGFPDASKLKVKYPKVASDLSRRQLLDRYAAAVARVHR